MKINFVLFSFFIEFCTPINLNLLNFPAPVAICFTSAFHPNMASIIIEIFITILFENKRKHFSGAVLNKWLNVYNILYFILLNFETEIAFHQLNICKQIRNTKHYNNNNTIAVSPQLTKTQIIKIIFVDTCTHVYTYVSYICINILFYVFLYVLCFLMSKLAFFRTSIQKCDYVCLNVFDFDNEF